VSNDAGGFLGLLVVLALIWVPYLWTDNTLTIFYAAVAPNLALFVGVFVWD